MNKIVAFTLGAALGGGLAYICTSHYYKKLIDTESAQDEAEDRLRMTEDELREYYIQGLKDLGVEVLDTAEDDIPDQYEEFIEKYARRTMVNPVEEEEDDEEDEEGFAPIEPNPFPYVIDEKEFDTRDEYSSATIHYYKGDEVFTDDDYNIIDDVSNFLGKAAADVAEAKEAVYVRNEVQTCDYEVLIFEDSYKHAVEGEDEDEEFGDMTDYPRFVNSFL